MGLKIEKVKDELIDFYAEVVIENGPRYKNWREWHHLYVDLFVSFFSMSYLLGHVVAIGIPVYFLYRLFG